MRSIVLQLGIGGNSSSVVSIHLTVTRRNLFCNLALVCLQCESLLWNRPSRKIARPVQHDCLLWPVSVRGRVELPSIRSSERMEGDVGSGTKTHQHGRDRCFGDTPPRSCRGAGCRSGHGPQLAIWRPTISSGAVNAGTVRIYLRAANGILTSHGQKVKTKGPPERGPFALRAYLPIGRVRYSLLTISLLIVLSVSNTPTPLAATDS